MTTQRQALYDVIGASLDVALLALGYKDFNPDQPRDEGGRFASAGGSGGRASERYQGKLPKEPAVRERFLQAVDAVAKVGLPPERIQYAGAGNTREINGEKYYQAGSYDPDSGKVLIYDASLDGTITESSAEETLVHEATHARFQGIARQADEVEYKQMRADRRNNPEHFDADRQPLPEHADKYPATRINSLFHGPKADEHIAEMKKQGGVSPYSQSHWDKISGGDITAFVQLAFEETMAEIAALDYAGRGDQVPAYWREKYEWTQAAMEAANG